MHFQLDLRVFPSLVSEYHAGQRNASAKFYHAPLAFSAVRYGLYRRSKSSEDASMWPG